MAPSLRTYIVDGAVHFKKNRKLLLAHVGNGFTVAVTLHSSIARA